MTDIQLKKVIVKPSVYGYSVRFEIRNGIHSIQVEYSSLDDFSMFAFVFFSSPLFSFEAVLFIRCSKHVHKRITYLGFTLLSGVGGIYHMEITFYMVD